MNQKQLSIFLEKNCPLAFQAKQRKLVHGVGRNDANYSTTMTDRGRQLRDPAYTAWNAMLQRCYANKGEGKQAAYKETSVCDEWKSFSSFRHWWLENWKEGRCLDKDLLSNSKSYSPETCIFVPEWLNNFVVFHTERKGNWPTGVSYSKKKFQAKASVKGKRISLGLFDTPEEASTAWKKNKREQALERKQEIDAIDHRIYPRIMEMIDGL